MKLTRHGLLTALLVVAALVWGLRLMLHRGADRWKRAMFLPLALVPLLTIPLVLAMGAVAQLPLARHTYAAMAESSQRQGLVVEAIEGLETIKTHNAANWAQRKWDRFTAATVDASIRLKDWSSIVVHFSMLVQQMNTVFLVIFGTYLIHAPDPADRITMGALIACVILSGRALAPLSQVAGLMVRLQQARVALEGVNNIVGRKSERDDTRSYISPGQVRGELRFENAGYRYRQGEQPGPLVLRGLNIRIAPGEKVALLGRIGSGKSTLLRMAAGLYTASEGSVLLDGMDMRQVDPADLRAQVSMLGQQPRLFFGTLRENLELGRSDRLASDEELMAALERFGLNKLVQAHPLALNLPVGEDGHGLSGGQRQMVGLTRLTLRDPRVLLFGQDVGVMGGVFRASDSLQERFGEERVFDTPLAEAGIVGLGIGLALGGMRPIAEVQFAGFLYPALDQILSHLGRYRHRTRGRFSLPMVVRAPYGGGVHTPEQHADSPEAVLAHAPGIKVVIPSNPYDAKGLLISSIECNDPVVFLEPKRLYNGPFDGHHDRPVVPWSKNELSQVPEGYYTVPLESATIFRPGNAVTVLAYGTMVWVADCAARETGVDAEVIDLRSIWPLDLDTIVASVQKTGHCVIVHEATRTSGFGAELMALVQEHCFYHLEAPIERVTGWDTPYPHAQEWAYFPGPGRNGEIGRASCRERV